MKKLFFVMLCLLILVPTGIKADSLDDLITNIENARRNLEEVHDKLRDARAGTIAGIPIPESLINELKASANINWNDFTINITTASLCYVAISSWSVPLSSGTP